MNRPKPHPAEVIANEILFDVAKVIKKKYKIKERGIGSGMPDWIIESFSIEFETKGPFPKSQLRKILLDSADELTNHINSNNEVQKYLVKRPFNINDVDIIIYNHDKDRREVYEPEIATAYISQGRLIFHTLDRGQLGFKNTYEETYEEALQKLQNPSQEDS